MDRRIYGALIAAPAIAAVSFAYYQYHTRQNLFFKLNVPDAEGKGLRGFFTKARNIIYRNTIQDRLWNYIEARSEEGNPESVLAAFDDYCYNYEWTWAIGDQKGESHISTYIYLCGEGGSSGHRSRKRDMSATHIE